MRHKRFGNQVRQGNRPVRVPKLLPLLLLVFLSSCPLLAGPLIDQAVEVGVLDSQTGLLYRVYEMRNSPLLPAEFRESDGSAVCGTALMAQAGAALLESKGEQRAKLATALARPIRQEQHVSASGRFRIHYSRTGTGAVDNIDDNQNSVPDFVDVGAAALDSMWTLQIEDLGYAEPIPDPNLGGGNEYDVYIVELGGRRSYGFTYPEDNSGFTTYTYMELDNNYTDAAYVTQGLDGLRVTIAHEFFHALHFAYYLGNDVHWWREASSTWMEDVAYPDVDDYLQYVPNFLLAPQKALDSGGGLTSDQRVYGASIFAHFLDQRYHRQTIREIWEEVSRKRSAALEHFDRALRQSTGDDLGTVIGGFALWNYFTGARWREGFYAEGDKYRTDLNPHLTRTVTLETVPEFAVKDSGRVDRLGAAYVRIEPRSRQGGLVLDTFLPRGSWNRQLALVDDDGVVVQPLTSGTERVRTWDRFDEIVVILVSTEETGFGYEYLITAEHDPDLTETSGPEVFALRQSYPNPFLPDEPDALDVTIEFDLPESLDEAQIRLSIFGSDGSLIWTRGPETLSWNFHKWPWDGRNSAGKLVGSGIYYYLLEANSQKAVRTLAVVRGPVRN